MISRLLLLLLLLLLGNGAARTKRGTCTAAGESWDAEVGMCAPIFKAPLALEASIMDAGHNQPCTGLYRYACGKWIDQHVNENRAFSYAQRKTQRRMAKLVSNTSTALGRFYASCMTPPLPRESQLEYGHLLEVVLGNVRTHADLPNAFGRLARMGYTAPFALSIERHPTRNRTVPVVVADGFPDSLDEGRIYQLMASTRDLNHYSVVDQQQKIVGILRIMRAQREHNSAAPLTSMEDVKAYLESGLDADMVRFAALPSWHAQRGWRQFFTALDGNAVRFAHDQLVWCPRGSLAYMQWLLGPEGVEAFSIHDWKAWIEFSLLYNGANYEPELPSNVYYRRHDRYGPLLGSDTRLYHRLPRADNITSAREQHCLTLTQYMLPGLTARAYIDAYVPDVEGVRRTVTKLTAAIVSALGRVVGETRWLNDGDRARIAAKLDNMLVRVIEPDDRDWPVEPFADRIAGDRYAHNLNMIRRYRVQRNLLEWHADTPLAFDRSALAYFGMSTTEVNAYYSPSTNSITLLAGILTPPFYSPLYGDITLYAILGSIVGHEVVHALDTHGLYYDEYGSYHARGILNDMGAFYDSTDCVVREYGDAPLGCESANAHYGNSTLGEDMADLTGVALAYRALAETRALPMSAQQQFFMVFSQAWCASYDQQHLCDAVANDEHAVPEMRVDRTLRNMREFRAAFACEEMPDMCHVYG